MENFSDFSFDKEPITIDHSWEFGCNRCFICDQPYKHSRFLKTEDAERGIFIVKDKIAHVSCNRITDSIRRKKDSLLELEFKQFLLKSGLRPMTFRQ